VRVRDALTRRSSARAHPLPPGQARWKRGRGGGCAAEASGGGDEAQRVRWRRDQELGVRRCACLRRAPPT